QKKTYKDISFFEGYPKKDISGKELIQEFNSLQYSISDADAAQIIENFQKNTTDIAQSGGAKTSANSNKETPKN
ncbi:MAG: hypothetical protein ABFD07_19385, partial [Methanobacterium sp.]